jgi:hypothetical protein
MVAIQLAINSIMNIKTTINDGSKPKEINKYLSDELNELNKSINIESPPFNINNSPDFSPDMYKLLETLKDTNYLLSGIDLENYIRLLQYLAAAVFMNPGSSEVDSIFEGYEPDRNYIREAELNWFPKNILEEKDISYYFNGPEGTLPALRSGAKA